MKLTLTIALSILAVGSACVLRAETAEQPATQPACAVKNKAEGKKPCVVFACCECQTMAMKAGKCSGCQKDMQAMHVLGAADGQAILCDCGANCTCDAKGIKDGKCACGKEVRKIACKGMQGCATNKCPLVADKTGKCCPGK
ncbi:MAG: hypothetical protein PHR35_01645 [Kiritimatiellae bacterium]|nr:hypothetical protein [Kiritimatiellia bacterium]